MVDVSSKARTQRTAEASAKLEMSPKVLKALAINPKGDPFEVARFAGIQAAKRTSELVPMCHVIPLSYVDISYALVTMASSFIPGLRQLMPPGWRWRR
jgi:cyclic pyranopterin phosphate synthase